jgi:hypothetical protein
MHLELAPPSCVLVDLRASGLLRAVGHDPTLVARPELPLVLPETGEGDAIDLPVEARFRADGIEPPHSIPEADRAKMREHMLGPEVLDARRHPAIDFRGRYRGTLAHGALVGHLVVRATPRPIELPLRATRAGDVLSVAGAWEGTLTELGIKPFKALLGALKLDDWLRLRVDVRVMVRAE